MRKVAGELEDFRRAIQTLTRWTDMTSPVPTVLVLFKDEASFDAYRPRDQNGRKRGNVAALSAPTPTTW